MVSEEPHSDALKPDPPLLRPLAPPIEPQPNEGRDDVSQLRQLADVRGAPHQNQHDRDAEGYRVAHLGAQRTHAYASATQIPRPTAAHAKRPPYTLTTALANSTLRQAFFGGGGGGSVGTTSLFAGSGSFIWSPEVVEGCSDVVGVSAFVVVGACDEIKCLVGGVSWISGASSSIGISGSGVLGSLPSSISSVTSHGVTGTG